MNGLRHGRRRWLALAALAGVLAIMAVGAGITLAINAGTAGELNYRHAETGITSAGPFTAQALCPRSRHVTGGGYSAAQTPDFEIEVSRPMDHGRDGDSVPDDGWLVVGNAPSPSGFTVWAICDD